MSETFFPINDLFRRKLQTALVTASLTLSVASTMFLLLAADQIGFSLLPTTGNTLTSSFSTVVWQFVILISILISAVGGVIVTFLVSVMMRQRIRDLGLIKAVGCPNQLLFGYYFTELLTMALIGCTVGTALGVLASLGSTTIFSIFGIQLIEKPLNLWIALVVFIVFLGLTLIFGVQPILATTRIEPVKAMSPSYYAGVRKEEPFKPISKFGFFAKNAFRQLIRRKYPSQKIVLCLSITFLLITVAVAGGLIASNTADAWIKQSFGSGTVLVAHRDMIMQYEGLLLKFSGANQNPQFNYTEPRYAVSQEILSILDTSPLLLGIDPRLVTWNHVREIPGVVLGGSSAETITIGDHHEGDSLIIGVEPAKVLSEWRMQGSFLAPSDVSEAVIGDSVARKVFVEPLVQEIDVGSETFGVKGVCLDPINNGYVTYVSIGHLEGIAGSVSPNIVLLGLEKSADRGEAIIGIRAMVQSVSSDFDAVDLADVISQNTEYMSYIWFSIALLPIFSLAIASLCLIGFVLVTIEEQRQEFGVFRAIGLTPRAVVKMISWQSLLTVLAGYGAGVSIGIMLTLTFLIPEPVTSLNTILYTAVLLLATFAVTFASSFYPAVKFSKESIVGTISRP
jgi:ABC-type antimicrobial peptide transport system permease subunit